MKLKIFLLFSLLVAVTFSVCAQDYDDIYYNSSKSKKKETVKTKQTEQKTKTINSTSDDTYISDGIENDRDVDEYNRRYTFAVDTIANDSIAIEETGDFVYTDRIRRFHNPTVIIETNNPELAEVYYISTTPSVNLIVGTPSYYWGAPYWYDWYYPYAWRTGWYSSVWYGPSWFTPWYGWGWSFGWTWGAPHHHHWAPGHIHHPGHGVASGGIHRPGYNVGGRRYSGAGNNYGIGRRPATPAVNRHNGVGLSNGTRRPSVGGTQSSGNNTRRPSFVNNTNNRQNKTNDSYNNTNRQSHRNSGYSSGSNGGSRGSSGGNRGGSGGGRGGRR